MRSPTPPGQSLRTDIERAAALSVPASDELVAPLPAGEICYQTFGDPGGDPLVLVMGLGGPMTWWSAELCEELALAGFFVIRYDNRDTGRSAKGTHRVRNIDLVRAFVTGRARSPYSLSDLADDAVGLLDHLEIPAAHVAGVSMGGMVAQTLALDHPDRVLSLTTIMSTTGRRTVGWQHPSLLPMLLSRRRDSREGYVRSSAALWDVIGSPDFPGDAEERRARAEETYDRGFDAAGVMRQMLAIVTQPDRTHRLRGVAAPTAVVHGLADKMVHVSGGRATAAAIPGAELVLIPGMGHDLPSELNSTYVEVIRRTADRADPGADR